jgi:polysaccharide export outer membrane protein
MKLSVTKLFLFITILFCFSCGSYKNVPYFQDLDHVKNTEEAINNFTALKIQTNDLIGIHVTSLNPEAAMVFNSGQGSGIEASANNNQVYGYRVDAGGEIKLPLLGNMKVAGMTTDQVAQQLTSDLTAYLKKPIVSVRLLNFKISVIGDVLKPDAYTVQNEHINIYEALSLAGDLNITAKRKTVFLIREQNGKREYFPIDLTKKEVFNQPYYYLQNNDILYVEPDKSKYSSVDRGYRNTSLLLSGLSAIAIVVSALLIQHR